MVPSAPLPEPPSVHAEQEHGAVGGGLEEATSIKELYSGTGRKEPGITQFQSPAVSRVTD